MACTVAGKVFIQLQKYIIASTIGFVGPITVGAIVASLSNRTSKVFYVAVSLAVFTPLSTVLDGLVESHVDADGSLPLKVAKSARLHHVACLYSHSAFSSIGNIYKRP